MAIIRCPVCNARVSSRAIECPACGAAIAGNVADEHARAGRDDMQRKIMRLKIHLLAAMTVFVAGAIWLFVQPIGASGQTNVPAIVVAFAGAVWYAGARFVIWHRRNR